MIRHETDSFRAPQRELVTNFLRLLAAVVTVAPVVSGEMRGGQA
jgi:hypothetical protein